MKIVLDVNMRADWKRLLESEGFEAILWHEVGDDRVEDDRIIHWAAENGYVVLTQDLDFGAALALLKLDRPSVVTLRTRNKRLQRSAPDVLWLLRHYQVDLEEGALIVIDPDNQRVRKLPLS